MIALVMRLTTQAQAMPMDNVGSPPAMVIEPTPNFSVVKAQIDGAVSRGLGLFAWEAEGWYGGDSDKLWLRTEGLWRGNEADDAELQALWSRNVSEFWDLQGGVRQDFAPTGRTYAVLGVQGLSPYFFETQAHLFISTHGDVSMRLRQSIDLPITQRWFIEPHAEAGLAVQDVPQERIGSGLSDIQIGLQARYEITRKFAPHVDLVWHKAFAATADFDRVNGEPPNELTLRAGIGFWF